MRCSQAIRLNPFKPCDGCPDGEPVPWSPYGRILSERPSFTLDPLFHAGCYYVQDSSAMYVGHVLRKHIEGPRVLDLCAAPGGKTTDIAASLRERFGDGFDLVSNEVMKARVRVLDDNVALWGDPCVTVTSADPAVIGSRLEGYFDVIVADVPCSGEGMFRKDERAREEWSEETVKLCAARQKRILADVWPALREGGVLVYSTCTYEDAENDANLEWAADTLGGEIFAPEDEFPLYGVRLTRHGNLLEAGVVPGEGQWVGALRKTSPAGHSKGTPADLHPIRMGIRKGVEKGGRLIPDADYALSLQYEGEYPDVEVDRGTALHFLHRDTIVLPDAPKGFLRVCYADRALGFVNNLGARCNNLHPQGRRILMDL